MKIFGIIDIGGLPGDPPPGGRYDGFFGGPYEALPVGLLPIPPKEGKLKPGSLKPEPPPGSLKPDPPNDGSFGAPPDPPNVGSTPPRPPGRVFGLL